MTAPANPPIKSRTPTTNPPPPAQPPSVRPAMGAPKGVAEGVPTALLPDPQTGDGRHVTCPLRTGTPMSEGRAAA